MRGLALSCGIIAVAALSLSQLTFAQELTNNFTEPFEKDAGGIRYLEFFAGTTDQRAVTPTHLWVLVVPNGDDDKIVIEGEYLSTFDHNKCRFDGVSDQGNTLEVNIQGVLTAGCDMRFKLTIGNASQRSESHQLWVAATGSVNVEVQDSATAVGPLRFVYVGGQTVRFMNGSVGQMSMVSVVADHAYLDLREVYYAPLSVRKSIKLYNQITTIRKCEDENSEELCWNAAAQKSNFHVSFPRNATLAEQLASLKVDGRVDLQPTSNVFINGGPIVEKDVTEHTEVETWEESDYLCSFDNDLSDGQSAYIKFGKGFGSHLSGSELPNYHYPAGNINGAVGSKGGLSLFGFAVWAACLTMLTSN